MAIGIALMAAGTAMQAFGKWGEGQAHAANALAQAEIARYNAMVADINARMQAEKTKFDQGRRLRAGMRSTGRLRAQLGASGALMSEGAPLMAVMEQESENALAVALVGAEGRTKEEQLRTQGKLDRVQAKIYEGKAKSSRKAGAIGTASTLLSGFGEMEQAGMFS